MTTTLFLHSDLIGWLPMNMTHLLYAFETPPVRMYMTTMRREHQGDGRRQGLRTEQRRVEEDEAVDAYTVGSMKVHWFCCGVRVSSLENNTGCG